MSECVCVEVLVYTKGQHGNIMKEVKCCHFSLHSVYHVVKILVQVELEWRKSSGVKVGTDQIQRMENFL